METSPKMKKRQNSCLQAAGDQLQACSKYGNPNRASRTFPKHQWGDDWICMDANTEADIYIKWLVSSLKIGLSS